MWCLLIKILFQRMAPEMAAVERLGGYDLKVSVALIKLIMNSQLSFTVIFHFFTHFYNSLLDFVMHTCIQWNSIFSERFKKSGFHCTFLIFDNFFFVFFCVISGLLV